MTEQTITSDQPVSLTFNISSPSVTLTFNTTAPTPEPQPEPEEPDGHGVPALGLSGFPWNSAVFYRNGNIAASKEFETWRKRRVDGVMHFVTRDTWDQMKVIPGDLKDYGGYRIIVTPSQPQSMDLQTTSTGGHDAFWRDQGKRLVDAGIADGRTIIRLNWECNLGSPWGYSRNGPGRFVSAYKHVVEAVWDSAPKIKFNVNFNRDNDVTGVDPFRDVLDPLKEHIALVGLDWYDHWPAQRTREIFAQVAAQSPGGDDLGAWGRANGKGLWLDEWGVSHWPGVSGGDNPGYMNFMWDWLVENQDVIAGETTYNDQGAPAYLNHVLSDGTNPLATAAYLSHWGG